MSKKGATMAQGAAFALALAGSTALMSWRLRRIDPSPALALLFDEWERPEYPPSIWRSST